MQRDAWSRLLFFLSIVFLFISISYFAYSYSNKVGVRGLREEVRDQEAELKSLKEAQEKAEKQIPEKEEEYRMLSSNFTNKYGFTPESLDKVSFQEEKARFENEQADILREMNKILEDTAYLYIGSGYEEEVVEEFLSKYLELSSRSDLEMKQDSLLKELNIDGVYPVITVEGAYRNFFRDFPFDESEKKYLIVHMFTLSYPLYEILHGNRSRNNPEDIYLNYRIMTDRMVSISEQFSLNESVEPLTEGCARLEKLLYKYREYDGVLAELERLESRKGQIDGRE